METEIDINGLHSARDVLDRGDVPRRKRYVSLTRASLCLIRGCQPEDIADWPTGEWIAMGQGGYLMLTD